MHELSLCSSIADTVSAHADGRAVRAVNLKIGHLRQVVPETLQFCWSMQSDDSPLAGAELVIEHVPAVVHCAACDTSTQLEHPIPVCGSCGTGDVEMLSGEEFLIASIDLDTTERPASTTRADASPGGT